ncbi:hypothetical protein FIE12Z_12764 [Fusarium flagelliforme]|uniref:Uncharacterized protein n=1 Tax=Fusarium flagelliforme TaxID=2675880 RepID=A0A395M536_9HYPO|nr:hypothetical protein FIE12Z_12764 [Fusarium flagelliforme]
MKLLASWPWITPKKAVPAIIAVLLVLFTYHTLSTTDILQPPRFSSSPTKTSRVHYLIPASQPSLNLCANIISGLANRYPIASILGYNGKDQFDAKAGHIAKLYSIQRYLHGPAGKHEDDLVIVIDGHDVLAQLPVEVIIERYFEIMGRHNKILADRFGLNIDEAGRKNIRQSVLFGADKACFPRLRDEPQCWAVPDSFLPHNVFGKYTQDRSMRYVDPKYLNSGTVIGPLGDLRQVIDAALLLIENTWNATFKYRNSDQYYLGKLYARQEVHRTEIMTGIVPRTKDSRILPPESDFGTSQMDLHIAVDYESAFTATQCANVEWMRNIAFSSPDHKSIIKKNNPKKQHPFKPFTIQMPGNVVTALTRLYEGLDYNEPASRWIRKVKLGTNIATGYIYPFYHGTCKKSNFIQRYEELWIYPHAKGLLEAAAKAKGSLTQQMVDRRRWIAARDAPEGRLGGVFTDDTDAFVSLEAFCGGYLGHLAPELAS